MGHFAPARLLLPRGYRDGLTLSNNSADSDHDIDIAVGVARDSGDDYNLELTAGLAKQIDATWAAGDHAGGLFSGTVSNDTWYHVFLIRKDSDGSIDAGFDTDVDAANIPSGYTAYRRLGGVLTNGSSNIKEFKQIGNVLIWVDGQVTDVNDSTPPTSWTDVTLTVPTGIQVRPLVSVDLAVNNTGPTRIIDLASGGSAPSGVPVRFIVRDDPGRCAFGEVSSLVTNTSAQIKHKANSSSNINVYALQLRGWIDPTL